MFPYYRIDVHNVHLSVREGFGGREGKSDDAGLLDWGWLCVSKWLARKLWAKSLTRRHCTSMMCLIRDCIRENESYSVSSLFCCNFLNLLFRHVHLLRGVSRNKSIIFPLFVDN
jgi:hypothetical protein